MLQVKSKFECDLKYLESLCVCGSVLRLLDCWEFRVKDISAVDSVFFLSSIVGDRYLFLLHI